MPYSLFFSGASDEPSSKAGSGSGPLPVAVLPPDERWLIEGFVAFGEDVRDSSAAVPKLTNAA